MIEEWGIRYEKTTGPPDMSGTRPEVTLTVGSQEIAEQAVGWEHPPWGSYRNRRVVRREVTEWAEVR